MHNHNTIDVLNKAFTKVDTGNGIYYSFKFGDEEQFELCIEPTLTGHFEIAVYENEELVVDKVPARPLAKGQ